MARPFISPNVSATRAAIAACAFLDRTRARSRSTNMRPNASTVARAAAPATVRDNLAVRDARDTGSRASASDPLTVRPGESPRSCS